MKATKNETNRKNGSAKRVATESGGNEFYVRARYHQTPLPAVLHNDGSVSIRLDRSDAYSCEFGVQQASDSVLDALSESEVGRVLLHHGDLSAMSEDEAIGALKRASRELDRVAGQINAALDRLPRTVTQGAGDRTGEAAVDIDEHMLAILDIVKQIPLPYRLKVEPSPMERAFSCPYYALAMRVILLESRLGQIAVEEGDDNDSAVKRAMQALGDAKAALTERNIDRAGALLAWND